MIARILKTIHHSGWEFWLPLPLIAVIFWVLGNAIALQVLTRSQTSTSTLQIVTLPVANSSVTILAINAAIDRQQEMTTVFVRIDDPTTREVKYEFPVVEVAQIEVAIAQELGVPTDTVRKLTSYRIRN